jgi:hypothetical protein
LFFIYDKCCAKNELEGRTVAYKTPINILFDVKEKWRSRFKQSFHIEEQLPNDYSVMELNQFLKLFYEKEGSLSIEEVLNKPSTDRAILPFICDKCCAKNEPEGRTVIYKFPINILFDVKEKGRVDLNSHSILKSNCQMN